MNPKAPHYMPPFGWNGHYWNVVSLQCQSSLVIWQSGEAALSVLTSCGNDTADLLFNTNEPQRGLWEPSEGVYRHPEVETWRTDPLLITLYTITCIQRVCVKQFNLVHMGYRSALVPRNVSQHKAKYKYKVQSHFADGHATTTSMY